MSFEMISSAAGVVAALGEPFKPKHLISPNIHVILVHFPLGIFIFGLFLEVCSFLWRGSSVRVAARWMILLGGLFSVPAAVTGIDALQDVDQNAVFKTDEGVHTLSPNQWAYMRKHVLLTSIGSGVAALGVTIGLGLSDRWRRRTYLPLLVVLAAAGGLMTFGAHFGGEGIYLEQVAVQLRGKPATGIEYVAPARSTHVLLAGLAIAVALGAVGASMRASAIAHGGDDEAVTRAELNALAGQPPAAVTPRRVTDDITVARTLNTETELPFPRMPAARFWLLSAVLFLVALAFGVWLLESGEMSHTFSELTVKSVGNDLLDIVRKLNPTNRKAIHVIVGTGLVVMPLILALVVRFGVRQRAAIGALSLVTVLLIAAEIWLGVLLIYGGSEGPFFRLKQPPAANAETAGAGTHISSILSGVSS